MTNLDFQMITLIKISADPNQPRKFYEDTAMQELTASIKESGVLQPILVRPTVKDKYMLICGERRFRASQQAGLKTIPAVIRTVTDEEALQLQIVENLQRKDVHPMEEAVAFKSFIDGKNWSYTEIGNRVGKSEFYVRQRLKLNSLIECWQNLYIQQLINNTTALKIATFDEATQMDIFNDADGETNSREKEVITISEYHWKKYDHNLLDAKFSLIDELLLPDAGPCTSCLFNSNYASLFPADGKAICNKGKCFNLKTELQFDKDLKESIEDFTIVCISGSYEVDKKTAALNIPTLLCSKDYDEYSKPNLNDRSYYNGDNDTEEEDEADYQEALGEYNNDMIAYEKGIKNGRYIKAFVCGGYDKGTFTYVKLEKNVKVYDVASDVVLDTNATAISDIESEISRLTTKEKRAKQLDEMKFYEAVLPNFEPKNLVISSTDRELTDLELQAVTWCIYDKLSWKQKDIFFKFFRFDEMKGIEDVSATMMVSILRWFMADVLVRPAETLSQGHNKFSNKCMEIGEYYFPVQMLQAKDNQEHATAKRIHKLEARLADLNAQLKELKPASKKAKK
jgi:ParB family transcriptional regulator, chromosome partitioning protein